MRREASKPGSLANRLRNFFGIDSEWERPLPSGWLRNDAMVAAIFCVASVLAVESQRAMGLPLNSWSRWPIIAAVVVGVLPLVWRRRFPVAVMMLTATHMFVFGQVQQVVMSNLGMQAVYFFAIFTALAWAPNRRITALAVAAVLLFMFGWLAVQWSSATFVDKVLGDVDPHEVDRSSALFGPMSGAVLYGLLINVAYFAIAVGTGANSWRAARSRAHIESQSRTITTQSEQLAHQAVIAERLRIARELHDVVAHHVSAMGIQAAAARKLLTKNPQRATESLSAVETSSREAVVQMRELLGTLRTREDGDISAPGDDGANASRNPQPGLATICDLVASTQSPGFDVRLVNELGAGVDDIPASVGHSLYRTVQEALANVRRHSTATSATVYLRRGFAETQPYVEAEILDAGRPRPGTSGSGLGLVGMRERVRAHHGSCEIGPRVTGGYRVRVRIPLEKRS